jgi:hypothetical protein
LELLKVPRRLRKKNGVVYPDGATQVEILTFEDRALLTPDRALLPVSFAMSSNGADEGTRAND